MTGALKAEQAFNMQHSLHRSQMGLCLFPCVRFIFLRRRHRPQTGSSGGRDVPADKRAENSTDLHPRSQSKTCLLLTAATAIQHAQLEANVTVSEILGGLCYSRQKCHN